MADQENGRKIAVFQQVGEYPAEGGHYEDWVSYSNDAEFEEQAAIDLAYKRGAESWIEEHVISDGSAKKNVHFMGSRWNAPWQPTGPTPNWGYKPPEKPKDEPIH